MAVIKAFIQGAREFRSDYTAHYNNLTLLDAYEWGREWMHRLTFRHFDKGE